MRETYKLECEKCGKEIIQRSFGYHTDVIICCNEKMIREKDRL